MRTNWKCVVCDRTGAIVHSRSLTARGIMADIREDHSAKSPWCDFEEQFVKVELDAYDPEPPATFLPVTLPSMGGGYGV